MCSHSDRRTADEVRLGLVVESGRELGDDSVRERVGPHQDLVADVVVGGDGGCPSVLEEESQISRSRPPTMRSWRSSLDFTTIAARPGSSRSTRHASPSGSAVGSGVRFPWRWTAGTHSRTLPDRTGTSSRKSCFAAVRTAVDDALTAHQRRVFVALALNEVPDVLAERLGTTRGALYKTLHEARGRLRTALAERGLGPDNWQTKSTPAA
jgi:hypothetical protein